MTTLAIQSGGGTAEIALRGAELKQWMCGGTELLWAGDPESWADTAPILFPVVGWTRGHAVKVDGKAYPLGLHGFARDLTFAVLEQGPAHVRLAASSDMRTRALYPFDWTLEVEIAVDGPRLAMRLSVRNRGERAMPYACGLHPGFRWPFAGGDPDEYTIVFAEREQGAVPIISPEGLFTHQTRRIPVDGRRLPLSEPLMAREALCLLHARSRSLRFGHRSGAGIEVDLEDFPHIALWSRPPGHFLCIEAWTGHGDHIDAEGDLFVKPSMRRLEPGASACHGAVYTYDRPHRILATK